VPVIDGTSGPTSLEEAKAFFAARPRRRRHDQAIAGGGGRGMRIVDDVLRLEEAYARCQSEAKAVRQRRRYVERLICNARHIECRSSATIMAPSAICGSANAPSSAATRN
jgi:pyruvate carboxylase